MQFSDTGLYIEDEALGNFARNTAASVETSGSVSMKKYSALALRAMRSLRGAAHFLDPESGAARWLLDNRYVAEREARESARTLTRSGRLPALVGEKRPAAAECAGALISAGRGRLSEKRIRIFLTEYQRRRPLREKELWLFIPILKSELTLFLAAAVTAKDVSEEVLKNVFDSYRLLSQTDLSELMESVNRLDECLSRDPSGIYPKMDAETRAAYRRETARIAKRQRMSETDAAKKAVELAALDGNGHVGKFLFKKPLGRAGKKPNAGAYIAANVILTAFFTVLAGITLRSVFAALLAMLPISEIVKNGLTLILTRVRPPRRIFRMDLKDGVPPEGRTVIVISALLASEADGEKYAELIEDYRLLNRTAGDEVRFGILADLTESQSEENEKDSAVISRAQEAIERLERRYGGGFYLFLRGRELNSADGLYMGRERKRGAIRELVRLITGNSSTLKVLSGDGEWLSGVKYILTLDADTRLTFDSAIELIGAALHPLNAPVISGGMVREGCGMIAPSVVPELKGANRSDFARIFAGLGGVDPYGSTASELYWDLFSEATFTGKGLIDAKAYSETLDSAFPENTLLSHDIIEGAYLGCAYAGDTAVTDGFPYKVTSYFSRLDRWTRGDWQNLRYLMPRVKNERGEQRDNPISELSKWKIFDNLRRSLTPPAAFISLMAFIFFGGGALAAAAAIALVMNLSGLMVSSVAAFIRHDGTVTARFHSAVLHGIWGVLAETGARLILLPAEAWTLARAAATAVFRMTVSRRGLLKWVTSSETEKRYGNTLGVNYLRLAACPVSGLAVLLFGRGYLAIMFGLLWLAAPVFAFALSAENGKKSKISGEGRGYLLACAADIWRWYCTFLKSEDNYLPPDNYQEEPNTGIAHRTSPTNIGFALLSAVTAADLGLAGEGEAAELIGKILDTVEKMPKWRGHLYNWYDTRTLEPLEPAYVSSVDSGNLAASLIAAGEAAIEMGDKKTAERLYVLVRDMDFTPLYDKKRELFRIGVSVPSLIPSEGVYDLLSSEARLLSYVATALGIVPRRHWRRLGRTMVPYAGYRGMASWTGTMFEYLMPELLLPEYPASLIYETSRFALYCQRKANPGIPWGASESAYYAFSHGLVYRYKAHGVSALALNREVENEKVISPYSSFLALEIDGRRAVKNLTRLESLGMVGRFGFYEAADFSGGKCEIVRSYMAHHLGMSMTAIGNALTGGRMRVRFMRDPRMRAYSELLEERLPVGALTLSREKIKTPKKPPRAEAGAYSESIAEPDPIAPRVLPLSNGRYAALISDTGKCLSKYRGLDIARWEPEPEGRGGLRLYLRTETELLPLTPAPEYSPRGKYSAVFSSGAAGLRADFGEIKAETEIYVPDGQTGECRRIRISSQDKKPREIRIVAWLEPCLLPKRDFDSHPAFWKLCMEAKLNDGALIIRRRKRGELKEACLSLTADRETRYFTHMKRGASPESFEFRSASPELCAGGEIKVRLENGQAELTIALAAGDSESEALRAGKEILKSRGCGAITRLDASALMLGLEAVEVREAMGLITPLMFPTARQPKKTAHTQPDLWRFGVSGDRPLIAALVTKPEEAQRLIRLHAFISENGLLSDLALLLTDSGDYLGRQRRSAIAELKKLGREGDDKVHLIDETAGREAILELADAVYGQWRREASSPVRLRTEKEPVFASDGKLACKLSGDGVFEMAMRSKLPPLNWVNVLTNGSFGYLASECGAGHMWALNARERQLTPWVADGISAEGPERLSLVRGDAEISLFADGLEWSTLVRHGFGWTSWERDIDGVKTRVTAFVPEGALCRVLIIELRGASEGDRIRYSSRLSLGSGWRPAKNTRTEYENGMISAGPSVSFMLTASREPAAFTTSMKSLLSGRLDGTLGFGEDACAAAEYDALDGIVIAAGSGGSGDLRALTDKKTALDALNAVKNRWRERLGLFSFKTADGRLETYAASWARYQTLSSRLMGRTGASQLGGAYGFRDQLQDAVNLLLTEPDIAAEVIKLAAAHQYLEGDVMHWWHPSPSGEGDRGVRTHCSDDLLWLPWALSEYALNTGELAICRHIAPYLSSLPLADNERDRYETAERSGEGTLIEHAKRAADLFLSRGVGTHGLPRMLGGDWNDGMNEVGGESVWLAFFASVSLSGLSRLLARLGDRESAGRYERAAEKLLQAGESAFENDRFLRGYYAGGEALGAKDSEECAIDSIAQSFAVFAGADGAKCETALKTALELLYDEKTRLVKLFTPPFHDEKAEPGYIKSYAPGFRENGGQYTHAAVWLAIALLESGMEEKGCELLYAILPSMRDTEEYCLEPYVLAGDVYSNADNVGRGGWSWYTGAAGWYHRAVAEHLLGLKLRDGRLYIEPRVPDSFGPVSVKLFDLEIEISGSGIRVNGEAYSPDGYRIRKFNNNFISNLSLS